MDPETIQKIAAEIAKHLPATSWSVLAIEVFVIMVAAWAGAYVGEYFKESGKQLATKAHFDELTKQLRTNTELVQAIQSEVAQRDWVKREWSNLRRLKLEELIACMHECEQFRILTSRALGMDPKAGLKDLDVDDPKKRFETLGILYFPEMKDAVTEYLSEHDGYMEVCKDSQFELNVSDGREKSAISAKMIGNLREPRNRLKGATQTLQKKARTLLLEIMDVPEAQGLQKSDAAAGSNAPPASAHG